MGQVLPREGVRRDAEAGRGCGWHLAFGWALLAGAVRSRAAALTRERETISRGLAQKRTFTSIAAELGRSVSTVSREVARNSGLNGYRAA